MGTRNGTIVHFAASSAQNSQIAYRLAYANYQKINIQKQISEIEKNPSLTQELKHAETNALNAELTNLEDLTSALLANYNSKLRTAAAGL